MGTSGGFGLTSTATTSSYVGNYPVTVSNFTQTGSNFSSRATQTGNLAVTPLGATLSVTAPSRTYDGTTAIAGSLVTSSTAISNKVGSDDVAISGAGAFTDKNVGSGNRSWDYTGLTLTGSTAANYYLASNTRSSNTGTITPKSVTWMVDNATSTYGTTATPGAANISGAISGDDLAATVAVYQTGTSTVVTPAARTAVGSYDEKVTTLSGVDAGNYTIAGSGNTTGTLSIAPKAISLSSNALTKTYDGATTYSVQAGDLTAIAGASDIVSGDALTAITLAYADKNAGTSKLVSASAATIGDGAAGNATSNYTISYVDAATSAITAKAVTIAAGPTATNKVYDGRTDATLSGGSLTAGDLVAGDTLSLFSSGTFADANAAVGKTVNLAYSLSGVSAGNYTLGGSTTGTTTANITAAALTMTANNNAMVVFDTDPTLTARYSGFVNGETDSVLSSISVTRAAGTTAGTYAITPSATSTNYTITPTNGTFTIYAADKLLIQVADASNKVYGDALPGFTAISAKYYNSTNSVLRTLTLTPSGGNSYSYDDANGTTGSFDLTTSATSASNVGNYAVTVSGFTKSGTNFTNQQTTDGNLAITQLAATLSADAVSKVYDGTRSATGATIGVSNKIGSDVVTASGTGNFSDKNAGSGKSYSFGGLTLGGAAAGNYYLSFGTLSGTDGVITPATLNVNYTGVNKVYDGTNTASVTSALQNLLGNDSVAVNTTAVYSAGKNVGTGKAIAVSGINLAGTDAGNYTTATTGSATGDITARALNVSYSGVDRLYNGGTTATVTTTDDRISGDTLSITRTAAFVDKNVGNGKLVNLSSVSLSSGDDGANYSVASTGTTSANITPKTLTVSFGAATNKTYDGSTVASVSSATDDRVTNDVLTINANAAFASKDATNGIAVNVSGVNLSGTDAGNYTPVLASGSLTANILKKALTMTGSTASNKTYDGSATATATAGTLSGFVGAETVSASLTGASFSDARAANGKTVTLAYTLADGDNGGLGSNYSLSNDTTTANISKKTLTATVSNTGVTKTYDGTTASTITPTYTFAGFVSGDTDAALTNTGKAFNDAHVANATTVTVSGLAISGITGSNSSVAGDYVLDATSKDVAATITKANATVTANSDLTKTYTGVAQSVNGFTASGLVNNETTTVLTGVTASGTGTNAGDYTSTASGTDGNYNLSFVNGTLRIAKANATVTANSDLTKTYTGVAQSVNGFTASGLVNNETTTVLTGVTASGTGTNAGDYTSTASGTDGNYNLSFVNGTLRIAKAHLTVTADDQSRLYGEANPTFTETLSGFVPGESSLVVTGTATGSSTAGFNTAAGSAIIVASASGLSATNYDFSNLVDGVLTIVANVEPTTVDTTPPPPLATIDPPVVVETSDTTVPPSGGLDLSVNASPIVETSAKSIDMVSGAVGEGGISVSLVRPPSVSESGIITVSVPKEMATSGSGFTFPLPAQIVETATTNAAEIKVTTVNGDALPSWLRYSAETKSFSATAVPDGAFPIEIIVTVNGQSTTIVISERAE